MTSIRWKLVNLLKCEHTYGYTTKSKRIEEEIEKAMQMMHLSLQVETRTL